MNIAMAKRVRFASVAQIEPTELQVSLWKFFNFFFFSFSMRQKKNQSDKGTDVSNVDLYRSSIWELFYLAP